MWRDRRLPHAAEEGRDDAILLALHFLAQCCSGLAPLEQHRAQRLIGLDQESGRVAVPNPETVDLLLGLHVRHADLQHCPRPVLTRHRRHPRGGRLR